MVTAICFDDEPLLLRDDGVWERLPSGGHPLGLFPEWGGRLGTVELGEGDLLVLFSDGVFDGMGDLPLADKEARLLKAAAETGMENIWQALQLAEASARDDMTCLTLVREN